MDTSGQVELIGTSGAIEQVKTLANRLGGTHVPILIEGETGTGKEVVARLLHQASGRDRFVRVDCAGFQDALVASELFGHEMGAFTGATRAKKGLIDEACNGTLFLDEIGELGLMEQKRLLSVLGCGEYRALGAIGTKKASFSLITATNRDLKREVANGAFRADLYYRISAVKIQVPALRERKEDIPLLAAHFLSALDPHLSLAAENLEALMRYDWPGNVRQLQSCIQRLVALADGNTISLENVPPTIRLELSPQTCEQPVTQPIGPSYTNEREEIADALSRCQNNRSLAAQKLGMGRATLYRRLRLYKLA